MIDNGNLADTDFVHACIDAARSLKSRASRGDRQTQVQPLVDILLSDRPLNAREREFLADLLMGELDKPKGQRLASLTQNRYDKQEHEVRAFYQAEKASGRKVSWRTAAEHIAEQYRLNANETTHLIRRVTK